MVSDKGMETNRSGEREMTVADVQKRISTISKAAEILEKMMKETQEEDEYSALNTAVWELMRDISQLKKIEVYSDGY